MEQSHAISTAHHNALQNFYPNTPVLVTGGCGFIGSHVTELLISYGARVTILDDLSTGSEKNIAHLAHKVHFIKGSITDPQTCLKATAGQKIIFHLAAATSVPDSVERPEFCHKINIDGTFNMLNAARLNSVERFVLSSSSAVYGAAEGASTETDLCYPVSPYGYSKLIDEYLCQQFSQNYGILVAMLRYFNVYGPRQNPHAAYAAVVAKFSELMEANKSLTIFGDGTQTRDFVHVTQVAYANVIAAMMLSLTTTGHAFNVASGKSINLFELIDLLKTNYPDYSGTIIFENARPGDVQRTAADCKKFQQTFGL